MLDAASCHCLGMKQIFHCKIPSSGQKAAAVLMWGLTCLLCHPWGLSAVVLILIPILLLHGFPKALADPFSAALRGGCGAGESRGSRVQGVEGRRGTSRCCVRLDE